LVVIKQSWFTHTTYIVAAYSVFVFVVVFTLI